MSMPTVSRGRALLYLAVAVAALVLAVRFLGPAGPPRAALQGETLAELAAEPPPPAAAPEQELLVVHVTGAVRRPGIYRLPAGSRVDDAIRQAGGVRPKATLEAVNLAAPLADGQQVVVPRRGVPPGSGTGATPEAVAPVAAGPVSLSNATLEELDALPGNRPGHRAEHPRLPNGERRIRLGRRARRRSGNRPGSARAAERARGSVRPPPAHLLAGSLALGLALSLAVRPRGPLVPGSRPRSRPCRAPARARASSGSGSLPRRRRRLVRRAPPRRARPESALGFGSDPASSYEPRSSAPGAGASSPSGCPCGSGSRPAVL